jgi:hypothetical protein
MCQAETTMLWATATEALLPATSSKTAILSAEVGVASPPRASGCLDECTSQPSVAADRSDRTTFARRLMAAGGHPRPRRQPLGHGKHRHVTAGFGDEDLRRRPPPAGDPAEQSDGRLKGPKPLDDLGAKTRDRRVKEGDVVEDLAGHHGMVGAEPPLERLDESVLLGPHPALREFGELLRIALAGDQSLDHGQRRLRPGTRRHRGQLDPGVLEQLLEPLNLFHPGVDLGLAVTSDLPQLADGRRRDEVGAHHSVSRHIGEPLRVG